MRRRLKIYIGICGGIFGLILLIIIMSASSGPSCKPGSYMNTNKDKCELCPPGYYCPFGEKRKVCPPGKEPEKQFGSKLCLDCTQDKYNDGHVAGYCEPCPVGTYGEKPG